MSDAPPWFQRPSYTLDDALWLVEQVRGHALASELAAAFMERTKSRELAAAELQLEACRKRCLTAEARVVELETKLKRTAS